MKRVLALMTMFCLVLGFQNCSQSNLQNAGDLSGDVSVIIPSEVGASESQSTVTYVEIPEVSAESSVSSKASSEALAGRLVISMQSGSIQLMDDANNVLSQRCLDSSRLKELKTILSGSSICATEVSADQICAMRMKSAYASLYADERRVNLGEEMDSCGRGKKDLCGGLADVFRSYVSYVRAHWAEMECE
ncbi:MAG: hypothetical protein AAGB31_06190 [Bdellovibrio sp.]